MIGLVLVGVALAAEPASLDDLVDEALARDPEARALSWDAEAALARGAAARRPMDPQLMVGAEALGAMKDGPMEPMAMVGAEQMFLGWGENRALGERFELDAERARVDEGRVALELRTRLWQTAARLDALQDEAHLLDEQIVAARALLTIGLEQYGAGADVARLTTSGTESAAEDVPATPPVVTPRGGGGGMSGMAMGGGMAGGTATGAGGMSGMGAGGAAGGGMDGMAGNAGMGGMASMDMSGFGLGPLLRLDADVARLEATRIALDARIAGEREVLAIYVGDEAAAVVAADPERFFGDPSGDASNPERALAEVDRRTAEADVTLARFEGRPDVMVQAMERVMPDGMLAGTDVMVGVTLPLWGGTTKRVDAARAELSAAEAREDLVDRELLAAVASARASLAAAEARARALDEVAVPRARTAWEVAARLFASNRAAADDAVQAWEGLVSVEREAVAARRDVELREAELARLEGR